MNDNPYCWTKFQPTDADVINEQAEAIAAGVLSAIKSAEDFFAKHKGHDFRHVEKDFDSAWDRCLNLAVAAAKQLRHDEDLDRPVLVITGGKK